jgi:hypothetical protein
MEIVLVLAVVVAIAMLYKTLQFANFKSQLMHALAQEGIAYNMANDLYTVHAKFAAQLRAQGLSTQDIAKGIAGVAQKANDQDLMARIRDLYGLTGKLASEIRLKSSTRGSDAFSASEFAALIGAFVASIKKHYDVSIEDGSTANRLLSATQRNDIETMCLVENEARRSVSQLAENDAAGFMFHFFWPQLHGGLAKADA